MRKFGIIAAVTGLFFIAASAITKVVYMARSASVVIIGGADGPTAVFVSGKPVGFITAAVIVLGIILVLAGSIAAAIRK